MTELQGDRISPIKYRESFSRCEGEALLEQMRPWAIEFEAELSEGRIMLTRLTVRHSPNWRWRDPDRFSTPAAGIDSTVIRRIPTGRLLSLVAPRVREHLALVAEAADEGVLDEVEARNLQAVRSNTDVRRPGRPSHSPEHLRRVAEVRIAVEAEGVSPINDEVARRMGLASAGQARNQVSAATRAGWLESPDKAGRIHRDPGWRLLAAWAAEDAPANRNQEDQ